MENSDYTLDFGKHRGKTLDDVPISYVIWLTGFKLEYTRKLEIKSDASEWVKINKADARVNAINFLQGKCWSCGEKLVPIGTSRSNGRAHGDWNGRFLHKKCWIELKREEQDDE